MKTAIETTAISYIKARIEKKAAQKNRAEQRALHECTENLDEEGEPHRYLACPTARPDRAEWCPNCKAMIPHYERYNRAVGKQAATLRALTILCMNS